MKKSAIHLFFALATFAEVSGAWAQAPDSCLKLMGPPNNLVQGWKNPDSIMVDSCPSSPTYLHRFAKQWFDIDFQYGSILPIPAGPVDTIIQVEWTQIDTAYPSVRAGFDTLQQKFGHFILNKDLPRDGDTSDFVDRGFSVRFDSLVDIDSAVNQIKAIPFLITALVSYHDREGGFSKVTVPSTESDFTIHPNPAYSEIRIQGKNLREVNTVQIFSIAGQLIKGKNISGNDPIIDTEDLPSEIYFLKVNGIFAGTFFVVH